MTQKGLISLYHFPAYVEPQKDIIHCSGTLSGGKHCPSIRFMEGFVEELEDSSGCNSTHALVQIPFPTVTGSLNSHPAAAVGHLCADKYYLVQFTWLLDSVKFTWFFGSVQFNWFLDWVQAHSRVFYLISNKNWFRV